MSRARSISPDGRAAVPANETVVVVSHRDDVHARAVLAKLAAVGGAASCGILFDTATFPMASDVAVRFDGTDTLAVYPALPDLYGQGARSVMRQAPDSARTHVALARCRSIYWRRPRPAIVDDALAFPDLQQYVAKCARETIEGLLERLALHGRVVDAPSAVARADLKVLQLDLAREVGLHVPRTLITNSPPDARAFIDAVRRDGADVISKSPSDLRHFAAHTELVDAEMHRRCDAIRYAPVILQERITGGADVRLIVVGERLFGMAQTPGAGFADVDSRADPSPRREPYEVPDDLRHLVLDLQGRLGLRFGAYDFKCDASGTPYFLEVNPSGQWLFVELATREPIAEALARFLWDGPGAEWCTAWPALRRDELDGLFPFSIADEYAALERAIAADAP